MIYLDNAATSYPKPESVYRKVDEVMRTVGGNPGRGSHRFSINALKAVFTARETVARLLKVKDSSRIVFTKNATEALNVAIKGALKNGGHVVTTSFEHNSVARTLRILEKTGHISVTEVRGKRPGYVDASDIEGHITKDTRLVSITHASNVFGEVLPVEAIAALCRKKGVLFLSDSSQTAGLIDTDLGSSDIDLYVATGHKGLLGPQGTGVLYIRETLDIEPLIDGGTGGVESVLPMPDKHEAGTVNTPGIAALGEGAAFILKEGITNIRKRESALIGRLLDGLLNIKGVNIIGPKDEASRVSLVCFTIDGVKAQDAGVRLDTEFSIMARSGTHCAPKAHESAGTYPEGAVRFSPGYFTTGADIDEAVRAVSVIAKGK